MHLAEREHALHEQVILFTVLTETIPNVPMERGLETRSLGNGIHQVVSHRGFMQEPNVPRALEEAAKRLELTIDPKETTYYLGRESVHAHQKGAFSRFAESLFSYLQRNAVTADENFKIPPRQVVEVGIQLDL